MGVVNAASDELCHFTTAPILPVNTKFAAGDPAQIDWSLLTTPPTVVGSTVTESEAVLAHCPPFGVKVYVPEVMLLTVAGFHVPVIPLFDVAGNVGGVLPWQNAGIAVKVGVTFGLTVIVTADENELPQEFCTIALK